MKEIILGALILSIIPITGVILNLIIYGKDVSCWENVFTTGLALDVIIAIFAFIAYIVGGLFI